MKSLFVRVISQVLIICMSAVSFQASAGMIGTGDVAGIAQPSAALSARTALASQFEIFGLPADTARDRVAALSDAEVLQLTGRLEDLPAGAGSSGLVLGAVFVVLFLIWRFGIRDQQAAAASKEPAKK